MCNKRKKDLLTTTHSGPVEYCGDSNIYICGGQEIVGANAKANFDTCQANDKNALCTTALNNDATKRSNGGPYTSPTPSDMSSPVGDDCNVKYWYCKKSGKIYQGIGAKELYEDDDQCQQTCGPRYPRACRNTGDPYFCEIVCQ